MTTSPYTRTTTNSPFVKRQTNSRVTYKDSYGTNLIRTNTCSLECPGAPKKRKYGMGGKTEKLDKLIRRWRELYGTP
jgi:hypothetical protein